MVGHHDPEGENIHRGKMNPALGKDGKKKVLNVLPPSTHRHGTFAALVAVTASKGAMREAKAVDAWLPHRVDVPSYGGDSFYGFTSMDWMGLGRDFPTRLYPNELVLGR